MQHVKIKFLQNCQVEDAQKQIVVRFSEGREYKMPYPSAMHWITRGKAVQVQEAAAKKPVQKVEAVEPEPEETEETEAEDVKVEDEPATPAPPKPQRKIKSGRR
ncbi:MAG: hypothetical protein LBS65_05520 [Desulfovibrio sp.]|jgi:hypothetical protein|nr:hypothetical protein [Desulfovibrio sp.]